MLARSPHRSPKDAERFRSPRYGVMSAQSTSIGTETLVPGDGNSTYENTMSHGRAAGLVTPERVWSSCPWR